MQFSCVNPLNFILLEKHIDKTSYCPGFFLKCIQCLKSLFDTSKKDFIFMCLSY